MIKVAFCSSVMNSGHIVRGVGSYTSNLLSILKKRADIQIYEFDDSSKIPDVDLVHYPFFDLFKRTLPMSKKFPTVVTIHDVTPLIFPRHYPSGIKGMLNYYYQKTALRGVAAVITDSLSSQKDILKRLGVDESKISPVHLAASERFQVINNAATLKRVREKYTLPSEFALFVGDVNWNKNLLNLAEGCMLAQIDLVLAGKGFEQKENLNHPELQSYREFLKRFGDNPKVHILGFVPTEDLVGIMNLARTTLLPSFYEGFGLPILESQSCGTPVITSNVSSMPEVAGDGALFVDPDNVDDIKVAIKTVLENKIKREDLTKKGFVNVKNFSWEKTADKTIEVYKKATI